MGILANGQGEELDGKVLRRTRLNSKSRRKKHDWIPRMGGFSIKQSNRILC